MEFLVKTKNRTNMSFINSTPRYIYKEKENINLKMHAP